MSVGRIWPRAIRLRASIAPVAPAWSTRHPHVPAQVGRWRGFRNSIQSTITMPSVPRLGRPRTPTRRSRILTALPELPPTRKLLSMQHSAPSAQMPLRKTVDAPTPTRFPACGKIADSSVFIRVSRYQLPLGRSRSAPGRRSLEKPGRWRPPLPRALWKAAKRGCPTVKTMKQHPHDSTLVMAY